MPSLITAPINCSSTGDNIVITGNSITPNIQVVGLYFQCGAATTVTIKQGTTAATGPMNFPLGGGLNLPNNGNVYFQCGSGTNFVLSLQIGLLGTINVAGQVMFYQF